MIPPAARTLWPLASKAVLRCTFYRGYGRSHPGEPRGVRSRPRIGLIPAYLGRACRGNV